MSATVLLSCRNAVTFTSPTLSPRRYTFINCCGCGRLPTGKFSTANRAVSLTRTTLPTKAVPAVMMRLSLPLLSATTLFVAGVAVLADEVSPFLPHGHNAQPDKTTTMTKLTNNLIKALTCHVIPQGQFSNNRFCLQHMVRRGGLVLAPRHIRDGMRHWNHEER